MVGNSYPLRRGRDTYHDWLPSSQLVNRSVFGVPLQCLADLADFADDVDQVAERRSALAVFDVGVARSRVLMHSTQFSMWYWVSGFVMGPGLSADFEQFLGIGGDLVAVDFDLAVFADEDRSPGPGPSRRPGADAVRCRWRTSCASSPAGRPLVLASPIGSRAGFVVGRLRVSNLPQG